MAALALSSVSLAGSVGAIELACRLLRIDFSNGPYYNYPVFYRKPNVPTGEAFFRRQGPENWTGRVIATGLRMSGSRERDYDDEPPVTIEYSSEGFRNPPDLADWDLAVVGDSFTELGALPYEQLFTTLMAQQLGLRVKNLGISFTATPAQTHLLRAFGKAPSTRRALLVWFEGNDLPGIASELSRLDSFRKKGVHPEMPSTQSSFIAAVGGLWATLTMPEVRHANAIYTHGGNETRVTIRYSPPSAAELTDKQRSNLQTVFADYARACLELGLEPWLAFMPCKHRVLRGHLKFLPIEPGSYEDARGYARKVRKWRGSDLPEFIGEEAQKNGLRFVDLTPALLQRTERGELTYNGIFDTHLNRLGAEVVANELTRAIQNSMPAAGASKEP